MFLRKNLRSILQCQRNVWCSSKRKFESLPVTLDPIVSAASLKKTLKKHNVNFEDGFTNVITSCPLCKEAKMKLYINKVTGLCMCQCNKYSCKWYVMEQYYATTSRKTKEKIKESIGMNGDFSEKWNRVVEVTNGIEALTSEQITDVIDKLGVPTLDSSTLTEMEVRVDKLQRNITIPLKGVNESIVGYTTVNLRTKQETPFPTTDCTGIIKVRGKKSSSNSGVVVGNLADFLFVKSLGLQMNILGLPHGLTSLPQTVLPALEHYDKLILWFGNDPQALDQAKLFAKKLDEKRCSFVRLPVDHGRITNNEAKDLINNAQPIWHKSITTFASLRDDVLCDLQNIEKVEGVKWKRFPALNKILKGHRKGELTILTGPTGSGKTTFMSEYSLDLAIQRVNTLWGSFEIRNSRLARTMLQQMAGVPLVDNLDKYDAFADDFEKLPIYYMTFHGQQAIKVVMDAVAHAQYVYDINHVIIDNVQFMMGTTDDSRYYDRFARQDQIISAFRTFATRKNCHVTLVIHPRKEKDTDDLTASSIFGGAKAAQEADNILIVQDKRLMSVKGKKYLQIVKNRYSGDLGVMLLNFDKKSLSYAQAAKSVGKTKDGNEKREDTGDKEER